LLIFISISRISNFVPKARNPYKTVSDSLFAENTPQQNQENLQILLSPSKQPNPFPGSNKLPGKGLPSEYKFTTAKSSPKYNCRLLRGILHGFNHIETEYSLTICNGKSHFENSLIS